MSEASPPFSDATWHPLADAGLRGRGEWRVSIGASGLSQPSGAGCGQDDGGGAEWCQVSGGVQVLTFFGLLI